MFMHFGLLANQIVMCREAYPTKSYPSAGLLPAVRSQAQGPSDTGGVPQGVAIGDPERILKTLKTWESAGFDSINFLTNAVEMLPQQASAQLPASVRETHYPAFQEPSADDLSGFA